jgi:hypothetical protein
MPPLRAIPWVLALSLGLVAFSPTEAFAYVDPGTGSYLFQLAAAGFLTGMFTLRRYWGAMKARFRGATKEASSHPSRQPSE